MLLVLLHTFSIWLLCYLIGVSEALLFGRFGNEPFTFFELVKIRLSKILLLIVLILSVWIPKQLCMYSMLAGFLSIPFFHHAGYFYTREKIDEQFYRTEKDLVCKAVVFIPAKVRIFGFLLSLALLLFYYKKFA